MELETAAGLALAEVEGAVEDLDLQEYDARVGTRSFGSTAFITVTIKRRE